MFLLNAGRGWEDVSGGRMPFKMVKIMKNDLLNVVVSEVIGEVKGTLPCSRERG